ncbi:MAG: helix-turn-helix domain-containing protein [Gemmatimonas sp.]|nr:helix-turn-helix domain-containing protein [Gemmatimonas sp.]
MHKLNEDRISVAEAAPIAGKSPRGLYRAIAKQHVPPGVYFRIGRDIHFSRSRLLEWIERGGSAATADDRGAA